MLRLPRDVVLDCLPVSRANGKGAISLLPGEQCIARFAVHPPRGTGFYFSDNIGEAVGRAKSNEHVNVIFHPADGFRHAFEISQNSTHIAVQTIDPFGTIGPHPIFRAENDMVMERQVGGWHGANSSQRTSGAHALLSGCPVVSLRSTTG